MVSEVEKRRKIDSVLLPPIKKANELANKLKLKSDALKIEMEKARVAVRVSKVRNAKLVRLNKGVGKGSVSRLKKFKLK